MADVVYMPLADYVAACEATRKKTGNSDLITSGELAGEIASIKTDSTSKYTWNNATYTITFTD